MTISHLKHTNHIQYILPLLLLPLLGFALGFAGCQKRQSLPLQPQLTAQAIGVNPFLWRASLNVVSFIPLASTDPYGGVIVTDYYMDDDVQNERLRLTIYILDQKLRADGLRVQLFREVKQAGKWVQAPANPKTATQLENAILASARRLWIASNAHTKQ